MSALAFSLILFSALMHALWNLLVKRSRDKTIYIWWMFVVSAALFTALLPFPAKRAGKSMSKRYTPSPPIDSP
jgi:hypothetical protein